MAGRFTKEEYMLLINTIREHRSLYDPLHKNYKCKIIRERSWEEIASVLGKTVKECRMKWRNLRDHYMRGHLKNGNRHMQWTFYEPLSFLEKIRNHTQMNESFLNEHRLSKAMYVKKCFVPKCPNTSLDLHKIFIRVPKLMELRKRWCAAVKRKNIPSARTPDVFCCEDHFIMEEDSENWLEHKMVKMRLRMKKNCLPHLNLTFNKNITNFNSPKLITVSKKEKVEMEEFADKTDFEKDSPITPYHFMETAADIYLPPTLREKPNASQREIGIQVNITNPTRTKKIGTSSLTTETDQNDDEDDVFSETEEKNTEKPNISHDAQDDDRLVVTTIVVEDQDETNEDVDKFMQNIGDRLKKLPQHSIDLAKMNILAQVTELELEQSWTISATEPYS